VNYVGAGAGAGAGALGALTYLLKRILYSLDFATPVPRPFSLAHLARPATNSFHGTPADMAGHPLDPLQAAFAASFLSRTLLLCLFTPLFLMITLPSAGLM